MLHEEGARIALCRHNLSYDFSFYEKIIVINKKIVQKLNQKHV